MNDDTDSVARTIYGEARGEGKQGMSAVANVIMNRVAKKTWYGLTPYEVCMKNNGKGIYQFSCWNGADPNRQVINDIDQNTTVFRDAIIIAISAIGCTLPDITGGATHYYDKRMPHPPAWAEGKTPCAAIGHHLFFNDIT